MLFRLILWSIGLLLAVGSRCNARVQTQLSRDMTVVLASSDGVARSYVISARRISSHAGSAANASCGLTFDSASAAARIFLANDAIGQIIGGLGAGTIQCRGNAAIVVWFYQLTMSLAPGPRPRRQAWPDAYVAHNPDGLVASRITREAAVAALDPDWTGAATQREKLMIWQVGCGAPVTGKVVDHKIVAEVPEHAMEQVS